VEHLKIKIKNYIERKRKRVVRDQFKMYKEEWRLKTVNGKIRQREGRKLILFSWK